MGYMYLERLRVISRRREPADIGLDHLCATFIVANFVHKVCIALMHELEKAKRSLTILFFGRYSNSRFRPHRSLT